MKVVELVVLAESDPPPDVVHVTPLLVGSLATVAVRFTTCPPSIVRFGLAIETVTPGWAIVMDTGAAATVTGVVAESVTETAKVNVPAVVGVPDMAPEEADIVIPVGSAPLAIANDFVPEPPLAEAVASL